jgi:biopolymer transport protein ExbB/TolQ
MTDGLITQYLAEILHRVAQFLMVPVMLVLAALLIFALFCLGSLVTEVFTERRHFRANIPAIINDIHDASFKGVEQVVETSQLLKPQKAALLMAVHNMGLTEDELYALAKMEIAKVDDRYRRTLLLTEQVTKIAPMMGLMCTLIPLGPGIVAMGQGDVNQLSMSLLIAFDGTVAGLVAAVVALVVTGIRKRWYNHYLIALESLMTSILDKAAEARRTGVTLPHDPSPIRSFVPGAAGAASAVGVSEGARASYASGTSDTTGASGKAGALGKASISGETEAPSAAEAPTRASARGRTKKATPDAS